MIGWLERRFAPFTERSAAANPFEDGRARQDEVEAVPAVALELSLPMGEPGETFVARMVVVAHIDEPEVGHPLERRPLGLAHEVAATLSHRVVHIRVGRAHVEVAEHEQFVGLVEFVRQLDPEKLEPGQLEFPRWRVNSPSVRGIQGHDAVAVDIGRDQARFVEWRAVFAGEPVGDAFESHVAEERNAAAATCADVRRLVAVFGKDAMGELRIGTPRFLERDHRWVFLDEETFDQIESAANGVHVPTDEPHVPTIGPMTAGEPTDRPEIADVLEHIRDLAEPLERQAVLERVGRVAAEALGSDLGFVGLLDGPDHLRLTGVHGGRSSALEKLQVERGRGLGGKVLALGSAASVVEYAVADTITHEYDAEIEREGLCGVLCLPLVVSGEIAGVAYVSDRTPREYSDTMIDRVLSAVESAQVALALADRSRLMTEAAVRRERERTARLLEATVGDHLGAIVAIAKSIAGDPNSSPELLEQATEIVATGAKASSALRGSLGDGASEDAAAVASPLSQRETQVIRLASRGLSNPEIASELFLARGTVKAYMESALQKLDARNRVEAVMIAARSGLLNDV